MRLNAGSPSPGKPAVLPGASPGSPGTARCTPSPPAPQPWAGQPPCPLLWRVLGRPAPRSPGCQFQASLVPASRPRAAPRLRTQPAPEFRRTERLSPPAPAPVRGRRGRRLAFLPLPAASGARGTDSGKLLEEDQREKGLREGHHWRTRGGSDRAVSVGEPKPGGIQFMGKEATTNPTQNRSREGRAGTSPAPNGGPGGELIPEVGAAPGA